MKKMLALTLATVMTMSLFTACGNAAQESEAPATTETAAAEAEAPAAEEEAAAEPATGTYTLYNTTGETITEIYLYESGSSDKGENLAGEGMRNNKSLVATYDGMSDTVLTLEFTTESGVTQKFETLHIEEAPIAMMSADAVAGATPISFTTPEDTGKYVINNTTGTVVTELYVYPVGEDKGENLAGEGLENEASVNVEYTGAVDSVLVVEFTMDNGETKAFETLHIEEATINLLSADAMTGATPIAFGY